MDEDQGQVVLRPGRRISTVGGSSSTSVCSTYAVGGDHARARLERSAKNVLVVGVVAFGVQSLGDDPPLQLEPDRDATTRQGQHAGRQTERPGPIAGAAAGFEAETREAACWAAPRATAVEAAVLATAAFEAGLFCAGLFCAEPFEAGVFCAEPIFAGAFATGGFATGGFGSATITSLSAVVDPGHPGTDPGDDLVADGAAPRGPVRRRRLTVGHRLRTA